MLMVEDKIKTGKYLQNNRFVVKIPVEICHIRLFFDIAILRDQYNDQPFLQIHTLQDGNLAIKKSIKDNHKNKGKEYHCHFITPPMVSYGAELASHRLLS